MYFIAFTETPKERPRLQLQPRSKPVENTPSSEGEEKPRPAPAPSSSIFGSAKPVDTAQREREIEERLMQQKISSESSRGDRRDRDRDRDWESRDSRDSRGYGGESRDTRDYRGSYSQRQEEDKENRY